MKPVNYAEIVATEDGEYYYKAKVCLVTLDENSGREKKANQNILVAADNLKQAVERLESSLSTMIVPWDIKAVQESPIVDIFPYFEDQTEGEVAEDSKEVGSITLACRYAGTCVLPSCLLDKCPGYKPVE
jgi:hypothetical protein